MNPINFFKASIVITLMFMAGACNKNTDTNIKHPDQPRSLTEEMMLENGANPDEASISENSGNVNEALNRTSGERRRNGHYLFTESNDTGTNTILVYEIKHNGLLYLKGTTASGGSGTGKALGSQGALVLDKNHEWLYAVNAGNNTVSSFKVHKNGSLTLSHTINSGGIMPVSITVYGDLLYVLNRGSDKIHGFRISPNGTLTDIPWSTRSLSGIKVDAPQILFTPDGARLVVTEKATNMISTFRLKRDGSVYPGIFTASVGQTPFGFEFSRDTFMIVSNAVGGGAGAGSATSYVINRGIPKDLNGAIPNLQSAPCWVAIAKYGRFAYITNTASNNISSYYIAPWGALYLVHLEAAKTGMAPLDIVVSANNYYVYELNSRSNTIGGYQRKFFGGLKFIGNTLSLPLGATGLATY